MGYTPIFETSDTPTPLRTDAVTVTRPAPRALLRFGGLTMDSASGVVRFRGKSISLTVEERVALAALLRRAGQIVSCEGLATLMGVPTAKVDGRIEALSATLRASGVSCLPLSVDGLGYVLWRC